MGTESEACRRFDGHDCLLSHESLMECFEVV
jgi:hypothetical protein